MNLQNSTFVHVCFQGTSVNITAFSIFGEVVTSWTCEAPPSSPAGPSLLAEWIACHGGRRQGDSRLPTVYVFFDAPPVQEVSTFKRMFGTIDLLPYIIGPTRVKDLSRGLLSSAESADTILRAHNEAQLLTFT